MHCIAILLSLFIQLMFLITSTIYCLKMRCYDKNSPEEQHSNFYDKCVPLH